MPCLPCHRRDLSISPLTTSGAVRPPALKPWQNRPRPDHCRPILDHFGDGLSVSTFFIPVACWPSCVTENTMRKRRAHGDHHTAFAP
ncbi:hypothetical protein K431DRAFT_288735 [Polychaeton citri CBS 116435]|uniref:Uncharacterized protein n=1 Tax=Polychaeton citri CBS 116435 TaxID=1314669 RepID=A0A9P4PYC7_9PEZI|nr:hypothetical protein K431DRAFT_288735 [Polychaeton citri CBS 116435]